MITRSGFKLGICPLMRQPANFTLTKDNVMTTEANDISEKNDFSIELANRAVETEVKNALSSLNKSKHRFAIADYGQKYYPGDKLRDNLDKFPNLSESDIDSYEKNNKSSQPNFDDTAQVLALIDSFDPEHYVWYKENERDTSQSSSRGGETLKSRVSDLTEQVHRMASALEAQRNLLHELQDQVS